jgi:hypothetical protein
MLGYPQRRKTEVRGERYPKVFGGAAVSDKPASIQVKVYFRQG